MCPSVYRHGGGVKRGSMFLPNIFIATLSMEKREDRFIQSLWPVDLLSQTPLHYAAQEGSLEAAKLLLEFTSVRVDQVDSHGKPAVDLALKRNFHDVYSLLEESA
jgi:ankyrin repeat protein